MADYSKLFTDGFHVLGGDKRRTELLVLAICQNGNVSISDEEQWSGDATMRSDVYLALRLEYVLAQGPCVIDCDTLRQDLKEGGRLAVLIDRILIGYGVGRDGSDRVGMLDTDAGDASMELRGTRKRYVDTRFDTYPVSEWFESTRWHVISNMGPREVTETEIERIVSDQIATARWGKVVLIGDLAAAIRDIAEQAAEELEDGDLA